MNFKLFIQQYHLLFEQRLNKELSKIQTSTLLKDSIAYSLLGGGKRIRPMILLAMLKAGGVDFDKGMSSAVALEMIHCYSLIHDDLPAMDDDDYRRGKLTNHKVYSEAQAILSGDGLLTYAFEILSHDQLNTPNIKLQLIALLAQCAGVEGMVAGQVIDMQAETTTLQQLEQMHHLKTGKLLSFPFKSSAYILEWSDSNISDLDNYCYHLGIAFQVQDDILEVTSDFESLGKSINSDSLNHKITYPMLLGLEGAKQKLLEHYTVAQQIVDKLPRQYRSLLLSILELVITRKQ